MADSLHKIIVGLDYGTTYSGVSYVTSSDDSLEKIEVINQWPGTSDTAFKVPTRIAYPTENPSLAVNKWGYSVTASMESYSWTKLLLDTHTKLTDFDDPSLRNLLGSGMMRIPADKSAQEVCNDFLTEVYQHMVKILSKKYSEDIYDITPVECWITVPAIWSDAAKAATKNAALMAGFGSRTNDTVRIITEPEAAALAALKPHLNLQSIDPIRPGDNVLVCDCGGGTVDITTYQIVRAHPQLDFREICVGMGGKVGSTYIDRNFDQWLTKTFGRAYTQIPLKKRGPGSALMRSFETAKRAFSSDVDDGTKERIIEIEHAYIKAPSSALFDEEEATLKLTFAEMKSFFDPVINDISRLMSSQADHVKNLGNEVDRVIIVGGFGDSDYLIEHMRVWCRSRRPKRPVLTCPPQCQSAIVKGAALRGLEDLKPSSRIARRHYGHSWGSTFCEGIDPERHSYYDEWDQRKRCRHRTEWGIKKGQMINGDTEATVTVSKTVSERASRSRDMRTTRTTIYCCNEDNAPEYSFGHGVQEVGHVVTEFSAAEVRTFPKRKIGRKTSRKLKYDLKITFSAEEGVLVFTTYIKGKQAGNTKVEFHND